jgi:putative endonuclease
MLWYVYLVRCCDGSLYCGISTDVGRRVDRHNACRGAKYTCSRRPVVLVWHKLVGTQRNAMFAERRIKKLSKESKERLVRGLATEEGVS